MNYEKIVEAKFIERENRFVARVELTGGEETSRGDSCRGNCGDSDGRIVRAHVKNTGRCRELLLPGSTVYLEDFTGRMGSRKMRYSLVAVEKEIGGGRRMLVNMDSQAPNKVVQEALADGRILLPGLTGLTNLADEAGKNRQTSDCFCEETSLTLIKPETTFGDSRFDFYVETARANELAESPSTGRAFIEVKGVTLEENGHARFPDAPTERGVKHINELIRAREAGYGAYIIFIVQMEGMRDVSPNDETHPQFGEALAKARKAGVEILAYECRVAPDRLEVKEQIKFKL